MTNQPTLVEEVEFAAFMRNNGFVFLADHNQTLACTVCGCAIAGDMYSQFWELHRTRCVMPSTGKHRRDENEALY